MSYKTMGESSLRYLLRKIIDHFRKPLVVENNGEAREYNSIIYSDGYIANGGEITHQDNYTVYESWDTNPIMTKEEMKYLEYDGAPYKIKDLYPDTYQTLTSPPPDIDYSQLVVADGLFEECINLKSAVGLDLSNAVSVNKLFYGCKELETVEGIKIPKVKDLQQAFYECEKLTDAPDINFSIAPDCYCCFVGCKSLPEIFPYTVDITHMEDQHSYRLMFANSSVKKVNLRAKFDLCREMNFAFYLQKMVDSGKIDLNDNIAKDTTLYHVSDFYVDSDSLYSALTLFPSITLGGGGKVEIEEITEEKYNAAQEKGINKYSSFNAPPYYFLEPVIRNSWSGDREIIDNNITTSYLSSRDGYNPRWCAGYREEDDGTKTYYEATFKEYVEVNLV